MSAVRLRLEGVTAGWTALPAVRGVDLDVAAGSVVALVGPNGSGKSSLLRTVYRVLRPWSGSVLLGSEELTDLWGAPAREVARTVGVLPQDQPTGFDFTVGQAVTHGRAPHLGVLDRPTARDRRVVADAMAAAECADLADRSLSTLSGGERQRVLLARALAQQPRLLVLDEPTNHLDPRHRLAILQLVRELGATVLVALHDLDLAARYADRIAVLRRGALVAVGEVTDVLTPTVLAEVFGVDGTVLADPADGRPRVLLRPRDDREPTNDPERSIP